ncbi:hypothetical protein ACIN8IBEIGE_20227 [Acinetobacter sp. 8I-beige]|nr:hypothetical protein ACIN8IBEIGE_20227 [Acinetobacter sp. 8I-beige]
MPILFVLQEMHDHACQRQQGVQCCNNYARTSCPKIHSIQSTVLHATDCATAHHVLDKKQFQNMYKSASTLDFSCRDYAVEC